MKFAPTPIALAIDLVAGIVLLATFFAGGNASWIVVLVLYVAVVLDDVRRLLED